MKKRFAIGYLNFFDNEMIVETVRADNLKAAVMKHSKLKPSEEIPKQENEEWLKSMPEDLDGIKRFFFDCDLAVDAVEL